MLTSPLNLPALGRRQPYTSSFDLAETCVFGKQSLGRLYCGSNSIDHPLSLSYGVILPSSLTIVLSLTLGYSPCPPVSVLGTGTYIINPRNFSWKFGVRRVGKPKFPSPSHFSCKVYGFTNIQTFVLRPESINWIFLASFVIPSVI